MNIDQIVVGASVGDAVTESALRIRDALSPLVDSAVYALHVDPRLEGHVGNVSRYPLPRHRSAEDVIIYHVSIGDDRLTDFVLSRGERLVLIYHNITPSSYFAHVDAEFSSLLDRGRRQLPALLERADAVLADSEFNASELRALGCDSVVVSPPPINLTRLLDVEPDPGIVERVTSRTGALVLFVGQLLPHKRPDLLLGAHHLLTTNYAGDSLLAIAGPDRNARYRDALRRYVDETAMHDTVWITGELTEAQLAALYRQADVLVTASEHEGFCVPVVEAFHFGLPVVARACGAIPETAGDAALLLPPDCSHAAHLAEAIRRVLVDDALRSDLIRRGHERSRRYSLDRTLAGTLRVIRDVVRTPRGAAA
jgi:glycosyltransferase involved in cell wall biosynthesis